MSENTSEINPLTALVKAQGGKALPAPSGNPLTDIARGLRPASVPISSSPTASPAQEGNPLTSVVNQMRAAQGGDMVDDALQNIPDADLVKAMRGLKLVHSGADESDLTTLGAKGFFDKKLTEAEQQHVEQVLERTNPSFLRPSEGDNPLLRGVKGVASGLVPWLNYLDIGSQVVKGAVHELARGGTIGDVIEAWKKTLTTNPNKLADRDSYSYIDILKDQGAPAWAALVFGLAGEMLLDPLNLVGLGETKAFKAADLLKSFSKITNPAEQAVAVGRALENLGDVSTPLKLWRKLTGVQDLDGAIRNLGRLAGIEGMDAMATVDIFKKLPVEVWTNPQTVAEAIKQGRKGFMLAGKVVAPGAQARIYGALDASTSWFGNNIIGRFFGTKFLSNTFRATQELKSIDLEDQMPWLKAWKAKIIAARGKAGEELVQETTRIFGNIGLKGRRLMQMMVENPNAINKLKTAEDMRRFMSSEAVRITFAAETFMDAAPKFKDIRKGYFNAIREFAADALRGFTKEAAEHMKYSDAEYHSAVEALTMVATRAEGLDVPQVARERLLEVLSDMGMKMPKGGSLKKAEDVAERIGDLIIQTADTNPSWRPAADRIIEYRASYEKAVAQMTNASKVYGKKFLELVPSLTSMTDSERAAFMLSLDDVRNEMRASGLIKAELGYMNEENLITNYAPHIIKRGSYDSLNAWKVHIENALRDVRPGSVKHRKYLQYLESIQNKLGEPLFDTDMASIFFKSEGEFIRLKTMDDGLRELAENVDLVRILPEDGLAPVGWVKASDLKLPPASAVAKMFEGKMIAKGVLTEANMILGRFMDPQKEMAGIERLVREVTSWWKHQTIIPIVQGSTHLRNKVSDMVRNYFNGLDDPAAYMDAMQVISHRKGAKDAELFISAAGKRFRASNILDEYIQRGGLDPDKLLLGEAGANVERLALQKTSKMRRYFDFSSLPNAGRTLNPVGRESFLSKMGEDVWEASENNSRLAMFIDGLRKGMDPQDAMNRMWKSMYDYSDVPEAIAEARKFLFPYIVFPFKNIPYWLSRVVVAPVKVSMINKVADEVKDWRVQAIQDDPQNIEYDDRLLSSWMKNQTAIPIKADDQGRVQFWVADNWLDILQLKDLDIVGLTQDLESQFNPFIREALMQAFNYDEYFGKSIVNRPSTAGPEGLDHDTGLLNYVKDTQKGVGFGLDGIPVRWLHTLRLVRLMNNIDRAVRESGLPAQERFMRFLGLRLYGVDFNQQKEFLAMDERSRIKEIKTLIKKEQRTRAMHPVAGKALPDWFQRMTGGIGENEQMRLYRLAYEEFLRIQRDPESRKSTIENAERVHPGITPILKELEKQYEGD